MKVAIYVRVSTSDQHPENQLIALEEYCKLRDWEITEEYTDKISGMKESRPSLDKLMQDARQRKFDIVLVWKLDRLGRSLQHLIQIIQEFKNLEIKFVCKTENIDTTTAQGELIFNIFGAIAQFERQLIVERIKLGLERRKKQGLKLGRPFGSKDKKRRKKSGYYLRYRKN